MRERTPLPGLLRTDAVREVHSKELDMLTSRRIENLFLTKVRDEAGEYYRAFLVPLSRMPDLFEAPDVFEETVLESVAIARTRGQEGQSRTTCLAKADEIARSMGITHLQILDLSCER